METKKFKDFSDVDFLSGDKPFSLFLRQLLSEFDRCANKGRELICDMALLLISLLFCSTHILFGAFPLGIALLCAMRRRLLPCLVGVLLGSMRLGPAGVVYVFLYLLIFAIRIAFSAPIERRKALPVCEHYFEELPQLRIALSILSGVLLSLYELAVGGVSKTTALFCGASVLLPPCFCLLFLGLCESNIGTDELFGFGKKKRNIWGNVSATYAQISLLGFIAATGFALDKFSIFGISLGLAFFTLSAFFVSKRFGTLKGCITGLVCALTLDAVYAPSLAALGLISGILWQFGSFYSFTLGAAAAIGWASYIGGIDGFIYIAPAVSTVALLSFPLFSHIRSDGEKMKEEMKNKIICEQTENAVCDCKEEGDRMFRLSHVFSELSRTVGESSAACRPKKEDYYEMCEQICARHCASCQHKSSCWENEKEAVSAFDSISEELYANGIMKKRSIPDALFEKCPHMKRILSGISEKATEMSIERIKGNKYAFISADYALISRLIENAAKNGQKEKEEDTALCGVLNQACVEAGVYAERIAAYGHRKKRIAIGCRKVETLKKAAPTLHKRFEDICGCRLSQVEFERTSEALTAKMYAIKKFDIEYAGASSPSESGEISGDKQKRFFTRDDYFYSIISDGMGSGKEASSTAELCVGFLELLLKSGSSKTVSMKMLNNLIRARGDECSATVDMLEIDLIYGRTTFLKSGAAISFVKRGEDIFRIRSKTVPIGLMKNLDAEKTDFEIEEGDLIIMLSDGIVGADEDLGWLLALLGKPLPDSLDECAKEIISRACKAVGLRDDMTVSLIKIKKAE